MKLTPAMQSALRKLNGHEIHGNHINDGEHLYSLNTWTVRALHQRGLIMHTRDHCWGEQYSAQGELVERYIVPVFVLTETGKEALQTLKQSDQPTSHERPSWVDRH